MLKFVSYFLLIAILLLPARANASKQPNIVADITDETVALVAFENQTYCAGVWISNDNILTANHCVEGLISALNKQKIANDDVIKPINELGLTINYAVKSELFGDAILKNHTATVVKFDKLHDLALLKTSEDDAPKHKFAHIITIKPSVGDPVHIMGHHAHLTWSYTPGAISAFRNYVQESRENGIFGPLIQISCAMWHGDSGGGVFSSHGELIGISSFIYGGIPNVGFVISYESIETFLLP